jgi:hypothetical protein
MTRSKDRYQPRVPSASQPKTLKTYATVAFARLPQPFGPALFVTHGTFALRSKAALQPLLRKAGYYPRQVT